MSQMMERKQQQKVSYFKLEKIGQGSFCKVYKGVDLNNEPLAIKVINKEEGNKLNPQMNQMIQEEVRVMKLLNKGNTEHILKYIDSAEDSQNKYIITELCKKETLYDLLLEEKRFTENRALFYFFQIKDGIYWMHYHGIAHRDIKLPNILIGLDQKIKIADFGFSKEQDGDLVTVLGTMTTVAPEVLMKKGYTLKADIFSLGQILCKMLFGDYLFVIQDYFAHFQYLQESIDTNLENSCQKFNISEQTKILLSQMLRVNPQERIDIVQINEMYPLGIYKNFQFSKESPQEQLSSQLRNKQQAQKQVNERIKKNSIQIFNSQGSFNSSKSSKENSKKISGSQNKTQQTTQQNIQQQITVNYKKSEKESIQLIEYNSFSCSGKIGSQKQIQQKSGMMKNAQVPTIQTNLKASGQKESSFKIYNNQNQNKNLGSSRYMSNQKSENKSHSQLEIQNQNYTKHAQSSQSTLNRANQSNQESNKDRKSQKSFNSSYTVQQNVKKTTYAKVQKLDDDEFKKQNELCKQKAIEKEVFFKLIDYIEQLRSIQNFIYQKYNELKQNDNKKMFLWDYVVFLGLLQIQNIQNIQENKHYINKEYQNLSTADFYHQQKQKLEKQRKDNLKFSVNLKVTSEELKNRLSLLKNEQKQQNDQLLAFIDIFQQQIDEHEQQNKYEEINLEDLNNKLDQQNSKISREQQQNNQMFKKL